MPFKIMPKSARMALAAPLPAPIPPTLAASTWIGWLRTDGKTWIAVCGAESWADCWELLDKVPGTNGCGRMVRLRGRRP